MVARKWVPIVLMVLAMLVCLSSLGAQTPPDDESLWRAFMSWFKTVPSVRTSPFTAWAQSQKAAGTPDPEIKRQMGVLVKMMLERTDWVELFYDKTFAVPLTGDPETDGFLSMKPSAIVVEAVKGVFPGTALDAGMGQGRNAVYLAQQGWQVTGFDLSGEAVKAAAANASQAGVQIDAVKASYADFDLGTARWDLIVMTYAWAPVDDAGFVSRLKTSLRPNGRVVFEHFLENPERPRPAVMHALKPGQLRELFGAFRLDRYEEFLGLGEWGGPDSQLVRMVAAKQ